MYPVPLIRTWQDAGQDETVLITVFCTLPAVAVSPHFQRDGVFVHRLLSQRRSNIGKGHFNNIECFTTCQLASGKTFNVVEMTLSTGLSLVAIIICSEKMAITYHSG